MRFTFHQNCCVTKSTKVSLVKCWSGDVLQFWVQSGCFLKMRTVSDFDLVSVLIISFCLSSVYHIVYRHLIIGSLFLCISAHLTVLLLLHAVSAFLLSITSSTPANYKLLVHKDVNELDFTGPFAVRCPDVRSAILAMRLPGTHRRGPSSL